MCRNVLFLKLVARERDSLGTGYHVFFFFFRRLLQLSRTNYPFFLSLYRRMDFSLQNDLKKHAASLFEYTFAWINSLEAGSRGIKIILDLLRARRMSTIGRLCPRGERDYNCRSILALRNPAATRFTDGILHSPVSYAYRRFTPAPHPSSFSTKNTRPQFILARRSSSRFIAACIAVNLSPLGFSGRGIRKRGITPPQIIPRGQRVVVVAALNGSTTGGFSSSNVELSLTGDKAHFGGCFLHSNRTQWPSLSFTGVSRRPIANAPRFYRYFSVPASWRFISRRGVRCREQLGFYTYFVNPVAKDISLEWLNPRRRF